MPTIAPGSRIGPYVTRDELGHGGMGTVVAAWDPRLRREVALKIMHTAAGDPSHRARVLREAQALARLADPHVVPIYDVGLHEGSLWVAMERVRGPTLAEWLGERRPWPAIVDAFMQAARGLSAAHAAGIVHRDFKPSNAMLGPDERVMVLDFGLAWAPGVDGARSGGTSTHRSETSRFDGGPRRPAPHGAEPRGAPHPRESVLGRDPLAFTLTAPGAVVGTVPYMAPEQHERSEVDARADQFALCVSLYEALAGVRPYAGELLQLVAAKLHGPPPPPRDSEAPRRVWAVVLRGLAPDPGARWPDIDALVDALEHARRRPPWIGAALGLGGLALVAAVVVAHGEDAQDDGRCRTTFERTQTYRQRQHEIATSFAATGRADAEQTAAAVQGQLERAAEGWAASATTACDGNRVLERAALDCVDGALDAADALVQVLVSGGDEAILHASRIVEGLPEPTACASAHGDTLRPIDADVRRELALSRALARSARDREALDAATRALALAAEYDDQRGSAHALFARAAIRMDTGAWDIAEEDMRNVLWSSIAIGDDDLASRAASKLVHLCVHRMDPECARPWVRYAEASLQRIDDVDAAADARAGLDLALADLALQRGELDEALTRYEQLLDDTIARGGERQLEVAMLHDAIGVVHAQARRHERALEMFTRAAELFDELRGPDRATSHERLAGTYHALGRIAEAREQLDIALQILDDTVGPDHPHAVRLRGNLLLVLLDEGKPAEALELGLRVLEAKRRIFGPEDVQVAMTLSNVGLAHAALDRHDEAVRSFEEALPLWERTLGPDHPQLWITLAGLAHSTLALGDAERARASTDRALRLLTLGGGEPSPDLLFTHANATWATGDRQAAVGTMQRVAAMLPGDAPHVPGRLHHDEAQQWLEDHESAHAVQAVVARSQ